MRFGDKMVGRTFQEAILDPNWMEYVLKWMKPKNFEEELFKKYVALVLEDYKPNVEVFLAKLQLIKLVAFAQHKQTDHKYLKC